MKSTLKHILAFFIIPILVVIIHLFLQKNSNQLSKADYYELVTIEKDKDEWYYEVYFKKKLLIKQDYIPAVRGNQYFYSKGDAEKTGRLVIEKLSQNTSPTISLNELYEHGVRVE